MTEREFFECLKKFYDPREYALIPQVRNGTGFQKRTRTADAIAISLWPSRGIYSIGFEFKDSRADWKKELSQPEKAEEIARYCSQWWVVVSDPKIVVKGELPPAWGLMHATDGTVKVLSRGDYAATETPGWPFIAAVLRAAREAAIPEAEVEKAIAAAVAAEQEKSFKASLAREKEREEKFSGRAAADYQMLSDNVRAFEEASGIRIDRWKNAHNMKSLGEAAKFVMNGGLDGIRDDLTRLATSAKRIAVMAEEAGKVADDTQGIRQAEAGRDEVEAVAAEGVDR